MSPPTRRERAWRLAFVVALLAATWLLLTAAAPSTGGFPHGDKLGHVALFALLALLARPAYPRLPAWGIFVALALFGAATELAQRSMPTRTGSLLDFGADALGAALVLLLPAPRR